MKRLLGSLLFLSLMTIGCGGGGNGESSAAPDSHAKQTAGPKLANGVARGGAFPEAVTLISRFDNGAATLCTGAFIGPKLLITAAHCAAELMTTTELVNIDVLHVAPDGAHEVFTAKMIHIPANWNEPQVIPGSDGVFAHPYDMAIVEIAEVYTGVTAVLSTIPPAISESLFIVGSGLDLQGIVHPEGLMGLATVGAVTADPSFILWLNQANQSFTCQGDSGGPNYHVVEGAIYLTGLTQGGFTKSGDCEVGGISLSLQLTAAHIEFIRTVAGNDFAFAG